MNRRQAMIQLKKILRDNSFERNAISKRGSLAFERLPFYKTSKKLFKQPMATGGKQYAFVLLLDVSASMGWLSDHRSRIHRAYVTIKNIIALIGDFVKIDVILFGNGFHHVTDTEFKTFKTDQDLQFFINMLFADCDIDGTTVTINTKKNRSIANGALYNKPFAIDLSNSTYEYLAFQHAVKLLKNFNGKTGIISVCDGDNYGIKNTSEIPHTAFERLNMRRLMYDDSIDVKINGVSINKHTVYTFRKDLEDAARQVDYIIGVGLEQDRGKDVYDNYVTIKDPEEIYKYVVKMMKILIG